MRHALLGMGLLFTTVVAHAEETAPLEVTWFGDELFAARSVFYQQDETGEGISIYVSSIAATCEEFAPQGHVQAPGEGAILLALETPLTTVQQEGLEWQFYPVFMSGPDKMYAFATLSSLDANGNSRVDQPQGPMDVIDKESVGQHGFVQTRFTDSTTLQGFFDVYYGGLEVGQPRRAWGTFTAHPCKFM